FTDHHVAEALLTSLTILAAIVALQAPTPRARLIHAGLTGVALSAYLMAWSGGALLVFVLCAWGISQYLLDDARRAAAPDDVIDAAGDSGPEPVAPVLLPAFGIALVTLLTLQDKTLWRFAIQMTAVLAGIALIAVTAGGRRLLRQLGAP